MFKSYQEFQPFFELVKELHLLRAVGDRKRYLEDR
jgi:hypothetical protein